jgi:hypothetical protein
LIDVYESAMDGDGRYGAVFERDDETSYFYLLDLTRKDDQIIEAFSAYSINELPAHASAVVRWNSSGDTAGLFVDGELAAVFDLRMLAEEQCGRWATEADARRFVSH